MELIAHIRPTKMVNGDIHAVYLVRVANECKGAIHYHFDSHGGRYAASTFKDGEYSYIGQYPTLLGARRKIAQFSSQ